MFFQQIIKIMLKLWINIKNKLWKKENVASTGNAGQTNYVTTKSGMIGFISLASVGEGRFLVEDLAITNSIKYKDIEKENFFSIKNVDDKLVYKNLTSALVVMNYFKIK